MLHSTKRNHEIVRNPMTVIADSGIADLTEEVVTVNSSQFNPIRHEKSDGNDN